MGRSIQISIVMMLTLVLEMNQYLPDRIDTLFLSSKYSMKPTELIIVDGINHSDLGSLKCVQNLQTAHDSSHKS